MQTIQIYEKWPQQQETTSPHWGHKASSEERKEQGGVRQTRVRVHAGEGETTVAFEGRNLAHRRGFFPCYVTSICITGSLSPSYCNINGETVQELQGLERKKDSEGRWRVKIMFNLSLCYVIIHNTKQRNTKEYKRGQTATDPEILTRLFETTY